jgi:TrmH family RNA methyltransferase
MNRPLITSVHNQRIKDAAKLRDRRQRQQARQCLIDGTREIDRAIDAKVKVTEAFFCDELCQSPDSARLLEKLRKADVSLQPCARNVFEKLAFGERTEGIVAVAEIPGRELRELVIPDNALIAVLVGIEKPGNVGAILRSADGAGFDAVIVADGGTDLYNPNCIRASLGTIFALSVCEATSADALAWLRDRKVRMLAARVDGAIDYSKADYQKSVAIVLGSEAEGLPDIWKGADIQAIQLPMRGIADSLNVSSTAAVLFYEALRHHTLGS